MKTIYLDICNTYISFLMLRRFFVIVSVVWLFEMLMSTVSTAAVPYVEWTKEFNNSQFYITDITADGDSNVYICGSTRASFFGPNPTNEFQSFLAKYDIHGNLLWGKQDLDYGAGAISTDTWGGVYVLENYSIQKFNSAGLLQWTASNGHPVIDYIEYPLAPTSLSIDKSGNIFTLGNYCWVRGGINWFVDFDSQLTKLNSSGTLLWTQPISTLNYDFARQVATDSQGNAFVAGMQENSIGRNGLVTKYDSSGNIKWNEQIGPSLNTGVWADANCIATDSKDNLYIAGYADLSLYGEPNYGKEIYLMKWDTSGNLQSIIREYGHYIFDVAVDSLGDQYMLDQFDGLYKFDSNGALLWNISPQSFDPHSYTSMAVNNDRIWVLNGSNNYYVISSIAIPEPSTFILICMCAMSMVLAKCSQGPRCVRQGLNK
jgi:hypothetical protein